MKLKEIFNKFKNSKYKKEIITITVIVFLITVVVTLRGTHAYYNYESAWTPMVRNGYYISEVPPIAMSGYKLNEEKSNCIPKDATYTMNGDNEFTVDAKGLVKVIVSQSKPNQVVCRIYYDMSGASNDILVFALVENENGTITQGDKTYAFESELPKSGYTDYECKNKDIATKVNFDGTKFTFETTGPNVCYTYFNKN